MTKPRERPILFSGPMVKAILKGRKTQTRRIVKMTDRAREALAAAGDPQFGPTGWARWEARGEGWNARCPHGGAGDRLWVREAWSHDASSPDTCRAAHEDAIASVGYGPCYRATEVAPDTLKWKPGIFMPRWASRITLEITEVRVQRLQEIGEEDARAEGVDEIKAKVPSARDAFHLLWESINEKRAPWSSNPFVWAITFKRLP